MVSDRFGTTQIEFYRHEIVQLNLSMKALIQDILNCKGSLEDLNELNSEGRKKLANLRNDIASFKLISIEEEKEPARSLIATEVKNYETELAATISSFQKANVSSLLAIDKSNRDQLLGNDDDEGSMLRNRKKKNREGLAKTSSNITDQLLSISRNLAETTQRSADTLDTLVNSSSTVDSTRSELDSTGSVIAQSGKLLAKYGRRENTDKFLVLLAFLFFLACVFYVIQRRLF